MTNAFFTRSLKESDPEIYAGIYKELTRQQNQIELIASENIVSKAVLLAAGSTAGFAAAGGYADGHVFVRGRSFDARRVRRVVGKMVQRRSVRRAQRGRLNRL